MQSATSTAEILVNKRREWMVVVGIGKPGSHRQGDRGRGDAALLISS